MNRTPDSSVLVAALAAWHPRHQDARAALKGVEVVVGHVLLETYSVLTRLPAPHRISATSAGLALGGLTWRVVGLSGQDQADLLSVCSSRGISGGTVYDALIAATARHHGLTLVTSDGRARRTYAGLQADHLVL